MTVPVESVAGEVYDNEEQLMVIESPLSERLFLDTRAPVMQLSVARTVKFHVPAADGVPVIKPAELMLNPEGNVPDTTLKVIGACPPDAVTGYEYVLPTVPEDSVDGELMLNAGHIAGFTVIVNSLLSGSEPAQPVPRGFALNV